MENPIKMDNLGVLLFLETPIYTHTHTHTPSKTTMEGSNRPYSHPKFQYQADKKGRELAKYHPTSCHEHEP